MQPLNWLHWQIYNLFFHMQNYSRGILTSCFLRIPHFKRRVKRILLLKFQQCVFTIYLVPPKRHWLAIEDILIEGQAFLVNSNCSDQIPVRKSECETQVPPNCPLWPINDPKEQYRSGYRLSKRQWNNPVNYPVGQNWQSVWVSPNCPPSHWQPLPLLCHSM